jgi:hypothetical protein
MSVDHDEIVAWFGRRVYPYFRQLLDARNFVNVAEHRSHEHFGNMTTLWRSPELSLQFINDREDLEVYVGPPGVDPRSDSDWLPLGRVLQYLGEIEEAWADTAVFANALSKRYSEISKIFEPSRFEESRTTLEAFADARYAEWRRRRGWS